MNYEKQFPVIHSNEQFTGSLVTTATLDNGVYYMDLSSTLHNDNKGPLTLQQYQIRVTPFVKVTSWAEYDKLTADFEQSLVTMPKVIDSERFNDMLEVLPPCRWHNCGGYEVFHVSERLTGDLVSWFAHTGDHYFEFTDTCRATDDHLRAKLNLVRL